MSLSTLLHNVKFFSKCKVERETCKAVTVKKMPLTIQNNGCFIQYVR
jgi:hypothetical protein